MTPAGAAQLDDLRLFVRVAAQPSFAEAARALGVSKAQVSKRIAVLESALQVPLFHRGPRSLSLTAQGQVALDGARRVLDELDQLGESLHHERAAATGLLRLCSSTGFGSRHLGPALSALAARQPGLQIQLELLDRRVDLVDEGFDLDLRVGQVHEGHLVARRIAHNRRVLCASPAYLARAGLPRTLDALARHACIPIRERDQDFGLWELDGPGGLARVRVGGPLSANHGGVARQWALDGHGVILRSMWDVHEDLAAGRLVRVLPGWSQAADVWAVSPVRVSSAGRVRACVEFLAGWFEAVRPWPAVD